MRFQFSVFSFQLKEWILVVEACKVVSHELCWLGNGSEQRRTKNSPAHLRTSRFHQLKTENRKLKTNAIELSSILKDIASR